MKALINCIKESLLDSEDDLMDTISVEDAIKEWIENNFSVDQLSIKSKKGKYVVNASSVKVTNLNITGFTNGLFEWGTVGEFCCECCDLLTSLNGLPERCKDLYIGFCNNITSLEGCSKIIEDYCGIYSNENLLTFKGAPQKIKHFYAANDEKVKNCEGLPENCDRISISDMSNDFSFEGVPDVNYLNIDCCTAIKNLHHLPKCNIIYIFFCPDLETLEGAPEKCKYFHITRCSKLKDFTGAPKECETFKCEECENLTSLNGLPKITKNYQIKMCGKRFTKPQINKYLREHYK